MIQQETIINGDWSDYDSRKLKFTRNVGSFDPHAGWEVTYLVNKITSCYQDVDPNAVKTAIYSFSQSNKPPYWRTQLVEWITKRLA